MHTPQVTRRGPNSFASELLQVSFGCPWGKCHFCNLYEHEDFGIVPMEHIVEDLDEIAATRRHPKSVLLLGGNPMGLPNSKLMPVLELIREKLPTVNGVSGFMSTADIKRKSDDDLRAMAETGVTSVILGTESGRDETLARMEKGHTAADILENYPRLTAAGIKYSVFYLLGMAGAGNGADNALRSAEVYSQLVPTTITMTTLTPYKGTKLRREVEDGSFTLAGESEVMEEAALFIENLRCETTISGSHDSNLFKIDGILPPSRSSLGRAGCRRMWKVALLCGAGPGRHLRPRRNAYRSNLNQRSIFIAANGVRGRFSPGRRWRKKALACPRASGAAQGGVRLTEKLRREAAGKRRCISC